LRLHRVFPFDERAGPGDRGGALFWPRWLQGSGRHDNPDRYGCIYVSESEVSGVAEALAPFRGSGSFLPGMLTRAGFPLALARLNLDTGTGAPHDLDDPRVLAAEDLRPSRVATSDRSVTQAYAAELFDREPVAAGIRWWSTLESLWTNVTLFDRAAASLDVESVRVLAMEREPVRHAAEFLGLRLD
jgi:hypothetical protein